jgi:hypothetical protein
MRSFKIYLATGCVVLCSLISFYQQSIAGPRTGAYHQYFVSVTGNDNNPGTRISPFKTIKKINRLHLTTGDAVYFKSGETFTGTLIISGVNTGNRSNPIVIASYGKGRATISADSLRAVSLYKTSYVTIKNLKLVGSGRKTGNRENGLAIINCENIKAENLDISGFQKSGVLIDSSSHIRSYRVFVHNNGSAGITVEGRASKKDSKDIRIAYCRAENNPGDPTRLDNHSGNGIVVGHCTNVVIDHCTATNNGWDMPRIGNGPVGIWAYEADSVTIEYCLSYHNKTSKGGADGAGFDLDGGVTNSVIQYCFSYGNQGCGYSIFQYWGASPWHDNVFRYNISENDGTVSDSRAGIHVWNSSGDATQFYNCKVYGNIIYNSKVAALSFSEKSKNNGFDFYHNIFVGKDSLIKGIDSVGKCKFIGNDWWSIKGGFNIHGIKSFKKWAIQSGQEQQDGKIVGLNKRPKFKRPGKASFTTASQIGTFNGYRLPPGSNLGILVTKM